MENSTDEDIFSDNENTESNADTNSETNAESEPNLIPEEVTRTIKIKKIPVETKEITRTVKIKKEKIKDEDEEKRIQKVLKYVKKQPQNLEEWTKARKYSRLQDLFGYTEDGDIEIGKVKEGDQKKIIVLPKYKEATSEHIMQIKKEKDEKIKNAEEEFTQAKRNLQNVMKEYLASEKSDVDVSEVLRANEEVLNLEAALNTIVKYPRNIIREFNTKLKESDLSFNPHDKRPIVTNVFKVEYTYFSPEDLFMLADDENVLNLEGSNNNYNSTNNSNNSNNSNSSNNSNNSRMSGGKNPLSMAAIMAIKARKAARGY
jgi:hypothetical protein